eukprot:CAMPEP_0117604274 /NCGR_PEP_ID=MMETSP0784-20121206/78596_1 /TAXON_ID=39447 /ORGANISM="" /LENGTH=48 /DNA_ID= /DNA_START= /DNA_END= /DNA_ORIENTATION=
MAAVASAQGGGRRRPAAPHCPASSHIIAKTLGNASPCAASGSPVCGSG